MLPPELVELILDEADLHSLCALNDTNRFWRRNITESDFQHKLQLSCPWFEPQFSHRKTWRECSLEYVRRQKPKCRFAPKLRLLDDEYKFSGLFQNPQDDFHSPYDDLIHIQCNLLRLLEDTSYTSEHGITVDLLETRPEYSDYSDDVEFEADIQARIFSYPHVVIIVYIAQSDGRYQDHCDVVVKFKDSPGLEPDVKQHFTVKGPPSVYSLGTHTFLFYIHSPCYYADFSNPAATYLQKDVGFVPVDIGQNDLRHAVVYDGLISFFGKKKHYCLQANVDGSPIRRATWIKHLFRCTEAQRDPWWGSRFVMLKKDQRTFVFDVRRRTIQKLDGDGTEGGTPKMFTWRDAMVISILVGSAVVHWAAIYYCYRLFS